MSVRSIALWLVLAGCQIVPPGALEARLDPDGDGVPWPEDCDDDDPDLSVPLTWYADADRDGFGDLAAPVEGCVAPAGAVADATDCDDDDATAFPGGVEICDGADDDCDGTPDDVATPPSWTLDVDGDGYGRDGTEIAQCARPTPAYAPFGGDCDDDDASVSPGTPEACNGYDDDCDGRVDDDDDVPGAPTWYADADLDGHGDPATGASACVAPVGTVAVGDDCDDDDDAIHPGAVEDDCDDPVDYNCDGFSGGDDADGDGFAACAECDDGDVARYPGADEWCDGEDDDCDGFVDEDAEDATAWFPDGDGDAFGDAGGAVTACAAPPGFVAASGDCADADPAIRPGADEVCDGDDNDCDEAIDDADPGLVGAPTWYADVDDDTWGDASAAVAACAPPDGTVARAGDCDDDLLDVHPDAPETDCEDPVDRNCDGSVGNTDGDGDGYVACADCQDADPLRHPGVVETCDGVDQDCDGVPDDDAPGAPTWYADADGDGFGDPLSPTTACARPEGHVVDGSDCDDDAFLVNPGAGNCGQIAIDVEDGVALTGPTGTRFGAAVAGLGDVDGDGSADVIVGAPWSGADARGAAFVFSGPFDADRAAPGGASLALLGEGQADEAGGAVSGVGDLGGDGRPEVLVGASRAGPGGSARGGVYLVVGGTTGSVGLGDADAERTAEASGDLAGAALSILRDVNGDGLPEVLVGAPGAGGVGAAYVLRPPLAGNASLALATARLAGEGASDRAGAAVCDAGDLAGDGSPWIAVGAPGRDAVAADAGFVYLVPGGAAGSAGLDGAPTRLRGTIAGEEAGAALASLPDIDGDGDDEILVGAPGAGGGAVYLVKGPVAGTFDLTSAWAVLEGEGVGDLAGAAVASADVTGDGLADLVIGAPGADGGLGAVYVWPSPVAQGTATLAGAPFKVTGGPGNLGLAVAGAGDLDGDGRADLLLGDADADTAWVVFGSLFTR